MFKVFLSFFSVVIFYSANSQAEGAKAIYKCLAQTPENTFLDLVVSEGPTETYMQVVELTRLNNDIDPGLVLGKTLSINNKTKAVKIDNQPASDCGGGKFEIEELTEEDKNSGYAYQKFSFSVACGAQDYIRFQGACGKVF